MIKEFCGGKAGWNDRAIFIETETGALRPDQKRPHSDSIKTNEKSKAKMFRPVPYQNSYQPSILGDLLSPTLSFFLWGPF